MTDHALAILIAAIWLVSAVLAYGVAYAWWTAEVPNGEHRAFSLFFAAGGPVSLAFACFLSDGARHGLRYR